MEKTNLLLDTDSYKSSHHLQYPPGTTGLYSYLESRGGRYTETVFFGLQPILQRLAQGFTLADVEEANEIIDARKIDTTWVPISHPTSYT